MLSTCGHTYTVNRTPYLLVHEAQRRNKPGVLTMILRFLSEHHGM